jgi:hypothetical protein
MSQISANLDWAWIKFVGLWLLCPLVIFLISLNLVQHWNRRGHK